MESTVEVDCEKRSEIKADSHSSNQNENEECEPDGVRMLLLRKAIEKTTRACVAAGRFSLFAKCHPSMAEKKLKALQGIHKQYQENLREAVTTEVNVMFEEENIPQLMNKLDKIVENSGAPKGETAWRPSGDPHKDIRAHLIPSKLKTKERLTKILDALEEENTNLIKVINVQRQNLQETDMKIAENCNRLVQVTKELDLKEIDNFIKAEMI